MRPFLTILTEILTGAARIPELTKLTQVGIPAGAEKVPGTTTLQPDFSLRFIRLHTLMVLIEKQTEMPRPDIIGDIAELQASTSTETFLISQQLFQTGQEQIRTLTCILVELVRETFPSERNRHQVMYYLRQTGPGSADLLFAPIHYGGLD